MSQIVSFFFIALISAIIGAKYHDRNIRNRYEELKQKQLTLFEEATSMLLTEAQKYTILHSDNASRAIEIIDTHLKQTETELSPELLLVLNEIRYYYNYSTVH